MAALFLFGLIKTNRSTWSLLLSLRYKLTRSIEKTALLHRCQNVFLAVYGEDSRLVQRRVTMIATIINIPAIIGIVYLVNGLIYQDFYWDILGQQDEQRGLFAFLIAFRIATFLFAVSSVFPVGAEVFIIFAIASTIFTELLSIFISRKIIKTAVSRSRRRYLLLNLFIIIFFIYIFPFVMLAIFMDNNIIVGIIMLCFPLIQGLTALILSLGGSSLWVLVIFSTLSSCIPIIVISLSYLTFSSPSFGRLVAKIFTILDKVPGDVIRDVGAAGTTVLPAISLFR